MDNNHKYYSNQTSMVRWYYKIKDPSNNIIKKKLTDLSCSQSIYFSFKNICLVTNTKDDFCEIEYLAWTHKDNLVKLNKAPNGEDFGITHYVNGSTSVIPSPGYHLITNYPDDISGYYYIFSLHDPFY